MSTLGVTSRGPAFEEGVDYNAMTSMVGMASIGFEVAEASLQPPQAIAILSAGDQVKDVFGKDSDKFTKVDSIDGHAILINGTSYNLGTNKVHNKENDHWETDANILMYKKDNSDSEYILEVDGKLIHITDANNTVEYGYINSNSFTIYDSQTDLDGFTAFAESMGITEHTKLGAKIVLKTLMRTMGYDINKLDESFMDPQADYLAFINQTLSPVIEAGLTATMSGLKSAIEFLKKIVQKASS
ncbi:hypothetical protein N9L24_04105 [Candidatus Marinamargulisbacteria bacterium]|nr:hypothetical protein [Candidatus Marinamargulisbacteria bacterium]